MAIDITLGSWDTQKEAAHFVREQVFVIEQKIPLDMEMDEADKVCLHSVARDANGAPIATGRLLPDGRIGRMAVLANARGAGVGRQILQRLVQAAKERGDKRVFLSSQINVVDFYLRFGFKIIGKEYVEAGIKHIDMEYYL